MRNAFLTARRAAILVAFFAANLYSATAFAQVAPKVRFVTTEGEFVVEVYPDKAPKTVANFLQYVKDKHYDGTIFHRVISTFMVQGGGFDANYKQKATRPPVVHEGQDALAKGGPRNTEGTLAMARANEPNSASSQFFINATNNSFLDHSSESAQGWGYAVFGRVVSGMDVVDQIELVATGRKGGHDDVPNDDVVILTAVEVV